MSLLARATTDLVEQVATLRRLVGRDAGADPPPRAMVLLHLSSLVKRFFTGFFAAYTIVVALVATGWAVGLWWRVTDDAPGRGPFSTLGGARGVDGFYHRGHLLLGRAHRADADGYRGGEGLRGGRCSPLTLLSASGGVIMASANDLIVLFLGLEILSLAVYVCWPLLHMRRFTSQEAGMKYLILGLSSAFSYGIASLVYGATGSTSLLAINVFPLRNVLTDNALLLRVRLPAGSLGFKIAAVSSACLVARCVPGAPSAVVVYMASGVKAAGFAGLLRTFVVAFDTRWLEWQPIVYVLAVFTLLVGTILAVVQTGREADDGLLVDLHRRLHPRRRAGRQRGRRGRGAVLPGRLHVHDRRHVRDHHAGRPAGRRPPRPRRLPGPGQGTPVLALAFTVLLLAQTGVLTSGFFASST